MFTTLRNTSRPSLGFLPRGFPDEALRRAHDAEGRGQVDVQHGVPLLVRHLLDDVVPGIAGIVDDDVEPALAVDAGRDEAFGEPSW